MPKQRVAILGGGIAALTAAYELTRTDDLRDRYEVTVYQLGWRLGGKCASGRDLRPGYGARILEHGLHIWAGFYENAFRMMRETYEALERPRGVPLSVWYDPSDRAGSAFWPRSHVTLEEHVAGGWRHWQLEMPRNRELPGDGGFLLPDPWTIAGSILDFATQLVQDTLADLVEDRLGFMGRLLHYSWVPAEGAAGRLGSSVAKSCRTGDQERAGNTSASALEISFAGVSRLVATLAQHLSSLSGGLIDRSNPGAMRQSLERLHAALADVVETLGMDDTLRRVWVIADVSLTTVRGLFSDDVVTRGFEAINHLDWTEWLKRHGASEATLESPLVRGIYDYVLAYENGDTGDRAKRRLEAGTAVHGIWRLVFTYRGALFWEMQAAMGECVFTPFYQLLKKRGVRFEFFHRVDALGLAEGGIGTVALGVQATLKDPDAGYDPLVKVGEIDCWPDRPRYEQLVEGERLAALEVDLEGAWTDWPDVGCKVLRRGEDFDAIVLGISLGALPRICGELISASERWRALVENVKVVQTQSVQLWMRPTAAQLGWSGPPTTLTGYAQPYNTWADMTFLAGNERWPAGAVGSIAYFCGPLGTMRPTGDPRGFAHEVRAAVREQVEHWLDRYAGSLWPEASPGGGDGFDYELLVDPEGRRGKARLDAQYWRGNVNPSETYVLSLPGTGALRLAADESGFDNLYLAGDWVRTNLNAGCIEAAVTAGIAASRAITGLQRSIYGEDDGRLAAERARSRTISAGKPAYIECGGTQSFRQPLELRDTTFRGFVLDADIGALERLCDRMLNVPAQGRTRFVPLVPKVILGFATIGAASSADEEQRHWGIMDEIDVAFWVPLAMLEPAGGGLRLADFAWYLPYVFVDNPWALTTGREVYGFPKALGRFSIPPSESSTGSLGVSTLTLDRFHSSNAAVERQIIEVRRTNRGPDGLQKRWKSLIDAGIELFGGVQGLGSEISRHLDRDVTLMELLRSLFSVMGSGGVRMVFLKQFRDAADPQRACYQRVITTRAQVETGSVADAGRLSGDYSLLLSECASHPIAADLGLLPGENPVSVAFRLSLSFTLQTGSEI